MQAENFLDIINIENSVIISEAKQVIEELINDFEDEYTNRKLLNQIVNRCFSTSSELIYNGDADSFHNLAVSFAQKNLSSFAIRVLDIGLMLFPYNPDLLADYIIYGIECQKHEQCKKCFILLMKMNHEKWTWRCYDFIIDYLVYLQDRGEINSINETQNNNNEMITIKDLLSEYKSRFQNDERPLVAMAKYYSIINKSDVEIMAILLEAVSNIDICPLSSLKLAKYYFEMGQFKESNALLERCKIFAQQLNLSDDYTQIYILSALCKISLFYQL